MILHFFVKKVWLSNKNTKTMCSFANRTMLWRKLCDSYVSFRISILFFATSRLSCNQIAAKSAKYWGMTIVFSFVGFWWFTLCSLRVNSRIRLLFAFRQHKPSQVEEDFCIAATQWHTQHKTVLQCVLHSPTSVGAWISSWISNKSKTFSKI